MKIIDKTPLQDEKGQLSLINRLQGMLKYGLSWPAELQAQMTIVSQLDRALEKGFVLIRNFTLPNSEIVIPIILLGPGGASVIHVTTVKGFFEAKGDQWNTVVNGKPQPAAVNLLSRVARYARAVQIFLERQQVDLNSPVEAVLIAADPGAHVESTRPTVRVVMSDAVKQFAASLLQARPVWRSDFVYSLADRIVEGRPAQEAAPIAPPLQQATGASRAQAIFNASEQAKPFDTNDLGFAFDDEPQTGQTAGAAAQAASGGARKSNRILGMTTAQVAILGLMLICQVCLVIGLLGLYLNRQ